MFFYSGGSIYFISFYFNLLALNKQDEFRFKIIFFFIHIHCSSLIIDKFFGFVERQRTRSQKNWKVGLMGEKSLIPSVLKQACFQPTGLLTAGVHKTPTVWVAKSFSSSLPYAVVYIFSYFPALIQKQYACQQSSLTEDHMIWPSVLTGQF